MEAAWLSCCASSRGCEDLALLTAHRSRKSDEDASTRFPTHAVSKSTRKFAPAPT